MNRSKRRTLEAAGFRVGDAEDFLQLTRKQRREVELRLSHSVRRRRKMRNKPSLPSE